jgi:hypothetical protein
MLTLAEVLRVQALSFHPAGGLLVVLLARGHLLFLDAGTRFTCFTGTKVQITSCGGAAGGALGLVGASSS